MTPHYQTAATAIGGRAGSAASADGRLRIRLATPSELGGAGGDGTNPEQLFAAGYAASLLSAIRLVAGRAEIAVADDANVTVTVVIGSAGGGQDQGLALAVAIDADLPGIAADAGRTLVEQAHAICPYANATRGNIELRITVA